MAQTYTSIQSAVLTDTTATVTFSNISQSYTDLVLKGSIRTNSSSATAYIKLNFNGDTGSNYFSSVLKNYTNTTVSRDTTVNGTFVDGGGYFYINDTTQTTNQFSNFEIYLSNYSSTTLKKPFSGHSFQNNNSDHYITLAGGNYGSTTAISSILITPSSSGSFIAGTRFDLYGILKP